MSHTKRSSGAKTGGGLRERLKKLLGVHEAPSRVAGAFAAAVFCGTCPFFLGVVLVLPLLLWGFKLNKPVTIGVSALLAANPLGIFVMLAQAWLGLKLLGRDVPDWLVRLDGRAMWEALRRSADALAVGAGGGGAAGDSPLALLWAFVVGGFVSSLAAGALVFGGVWGWLTVRRRPA